MSPPPAKPAHDGPITFFNRDSGTLEREAVYGGALLRWAYGNPLGRLTVQLALKRAWFSHWYGKRMRRPASRKKIAPFIEHFQLDAAEFEAPIESYASFDAFFSRRLKPGSRPVDAVPERIVFPADGRHLAFPDLDRQTDFYIKGQRFNLSAFLDSAALGQEFSGGSMLVSRLCPVDYHRYHFPFGGHAAHPGLIGGDLRSVSPIALRRRLEIFWTNKRCLTRLSSERLGDILIVEVGATCVGTIHQTFRAGPVAKGEEKGYFSFGGSCVVTLFQRGKIRFDRDLLEHSALGREVYARMGEGCATAITV